MSAQFFLDRVFVLFIFHHGVQRTYKCFAYVPPRGWIWVRRGLCGFGDIRSSVGRYNPWGIKATGFAVTTKINHYAAVTDIREQIRLALEWVGNSKRGEQPRSIVLPGTEEEHRKEALERATRLSEGARKQCLEVGEDPEGRGQISGGE